jgi:quercetin dioxygenase-like cupin family protein
VQFIEPGAYVMKFLPAIFSVIITTGFAASAEEEIDMSKNPVKQNLLVNEVLSNTPDHNLKAVTVQLEPGVTVPSHTHGGFVFVFVLEGTVRSQLNNAKTIEFKTGEYWVEPPGTVHSVTQNTSQTEIAKVLAVFVVNKDEQLTTFSEHADNL